MAEIEDNSPTITISSPTKPGRLSWSLISAVNNEAVLKSCLLNSPEFELASEVILQRGHKSAASAYNQAIDNAKTDILVFAHQDVFLPQGWADSLEQALVALSKQDPAWAVAGIWGIKPDGKRSGHLYCGANSRILGNAFSCGIEVLSLDEVLLIVRRSSGVRFDEHLEGFHMYGTDVCLTAKARGLKSYAVSLFCVHNTNGYNLLPLDFWKAYFFMRRKWKSELPITTSCTKITAWCWPMIWWNADRMANLLLKRHKPGRRVDDPRSIYEELRRSGRLSSTSSLINST